MSRDMSRAQFDRECAKRGFRPHGVLGYYDVGHGTSVSVMNAGPRRRDRLAYLIDQAGRAARRQVSPVTRLYREPDANTGRDPFHDSRRRPRTPPEQPAREPEDSASPTVVAAYQPARVS
jgi:hypothetical protein